MVMRHYRAQVIIPHDNGLPEDSVVNTWHFMGDDGTTDVVNAGDFQTQLGSFYVDVVAYCGSTQMNWAATAIKYTVFEDPKPRIPFLEASVNYGTGLAAGSDWPPDVAIVLSMEGAKVSGANMRRRRGRVYLGPLAFAAGDQPVLDSGSADHIANAADTAFFGAGNTVLSVYSPYTHHGITPGNRLQKTDPEIPANLSASFNEVTKVWVDNGFDTQRRRSTAPSYRHTHTK